jgi:hypothetical protein
MVVELVVLMEVVVVVSVGRRSRHRRMKMQ